MDCFSILLFYDRIQDRKIILLSLYHLANIERAYSGMGFCIDGNDYFDVFLSYARADNVSHNSWVNDFEMYLNKQIPAELKRRGDSARTRSSFFKICRDKTGFPESGELESVIDDKVNKSQFLFIFLGKDYLNSKWCLSELDIFRKKAGGAIEDVIDRLYLIVLDQDAVARLQEGFAPDNLLRPRKHLWKQLQKITNKAIRKEDFLVGNDTLLPVFRDKDHADESFHNACKPLVNELTERLITHRIKLHPEPAPLKEKLLVIGAVPERLEEARNELVKALGHSGVRVIHVSELENVEKRENVFKDFKRAKLLIQPFDRYETIVIRGEDQIGGHLGFQKKFFEKFQDTSHGYDVSIIWWEPLIDEPVNAKAIHDFDKLFFEEIDTLPEEQKKCCRAHELADELLSSEKMSSIAARVWIEWEESDEKKIKQAKNLVREQFDAHCREQKKQGIHINPVLKFGWANWSNLEKELEERPEGVVIVYNENKDFHALKEQERTISNLPEVLLKKMFPGLFYMRPKGMYQPTEDWRVVRFKVKDHILEYNHEELEGFVRRLFKVIYRKHH